MFRPFPSKIFQIPTLQQLGLSFNENLTGTLPEFPQRSALRELSLAGTSFTGSLPDSIANLPSLTRVDLNGCNFGGPIPATMGNLTNLVFLDMSNNNLSNNIAPLSSAQLSLKKLDLHNSYLSGEIHEFSNASSSVLETLDLSNNHLNGSIPGSIFKLNRLSKLFLFSNSFSGTINIEAVNEPPLIFQTTKLKGIYLQFGQLEI